MNTTKYAIWAVRSAGSRLGPAEGWVKEDGEPLVFDTMAEAEAKAAGYNRNLRSAHIHYTARKFEHPKYPDIT